MTELDNPQAQADHDFPTLDSLRALGALAVLTTHTAFNAGAYTRNGVWGALLARLDLGVALFFVLSGFLLTRPYLARAHIGAPPPHVGRYFWKRALRIYPAYAVAVVLSFMLIGQNAPVSGRDWLRTLSLTDVYVAAKLPYGLTQMWSLDVEVAFYLVLPLLLFALLGRARGRLRPARVTAGILVMGAVCVLWHLEIAPRLVPEAVGAPYQWLPAYLTWFAGGMYLALLHELVVTGRRLGRVGGLLVLLVRQPGSAWTVAAGLMLVAASPVAGPTLLVALTPHQSLTKNLIYTVVGILLVGTGVFSSSVSRYSRFMARPLLRHLGHISYGVFCIHLVVLDQVMHVTGFQLFRGHGWQIWLLTVAVSLVGAELLYRFVERPAMRLRNLGRSRREPSPASTRAPTTGTSTR